MIRLQSEGAHMKASDSALLEWSEGCSTLADDIRERLDGPLQVVDKSRGGKVRSVVVHAAFLGGRHRQSGITQPLRPCQKFGGCPSVFSKLLSLVIAAGMVRAICRYSLPGTEVDTRDWTKHLGNPS